MSLGTVPASDALRLSAKPVLLCLLRDPEFDPSDCSSPFPPIKLYQESGVMETTRQEPELTPSSSVLLASWRQAHWLMERPLNLHGPLRQISSPPQQQAALAPQRQGPLASLSPQWLQLSGSPAKAPPPEFLRYQRSAAQLCDSHHCPSEI